MHGKERVPAMQINVICPACRARLRVPEGAGGPLYCCPRCRAEIPADDGANPATTHADPFAADNAIARWPLPVNEPLDFNRLGRPSLAQQYLREQPWIEVDAPIHLLLTILLAIVALAVVIGLTCSFADGACK
jgi:hypothetical protein